MQYVILAFLIIFVIGFFVVLWKAARDWRWYHIVFALFAMILAVTFIFPVAVALKSRAAWHLTKEKLEKREEKAAEEQYAIKFGSASDPELSQGLMSLTQQLSEVAVETGRVWRSLNMQQNDPNSIVLTKPQNNEEVPPGMEPSEAEEAVATDPVPLLPPDLVVYGFAEQTLPDSQIRVPTFYLGEFRVSSSSPERATLVPTMPLEPSQIQAIESGRPKSWSVYELLPLDGHQMFVAEGSVPNADNIFGRVDEEQVKMLFGDRVPPETLNSYLRDGSKSTQDDPPLSRWTLVEFIKKHKIEVDSTDSRGALDGGYFDGSGRAVDSRLQRAEGNDVEFEVGERIVVSEDAAKLLLDENVVKPISYHYLRPLIDYRFGLRNMRLRLNQLAIRKQEVEFEQKVLEESIRATESMLTSNQVIKRNLEEDFTQVEKERIAIDEYQKKVSEELKETRETLVRLYRSNQTLENELTQIHERIKSNIDAITAAY
ncbi:hypothetical protein Q31b_41780 [Novipirellula aureliae]|uniref:Uncharacterized protein n=1 Tax=Novipirellula aureliae TaxID=2527966 RepID=A0A5C6DVI7_9BACT|nr:hypothetical protein [Novipirellula aureliae]TWU39096.1 hypothetical protein Q31b_41780 [Novipirellula aureliae]